MPRSGTVNRKRLLLFRLIIAGISSILVLAACEAFLRLRPIHDRYVDTAIETPQLTPPGQPEFRPSPPPSFAKAPGVFRLLVIGDSYTFGDGVYPEDAYPHRLETKLGELWRDADVEVFTWARRGWNTSQQWLSIKPHLEELDPDLLLIGFTLNDTELADPGGRARAREEVLPRSPGNLASQWFYDRSVLYRSLWSSLENIRLRRALSTYYRQLLRDADGVAACRRALRDFRRWSRNHDVPLMVVIFPIFDSQLDHRYRYRDAHGAILDRIDGIGIPVVDLLPHYEGLDARRLAVTPFTDPHPNELGHRIAADAILHHLLRKRIIPEAGPPALDKEPDQ